MKTLGDRMKGYEAVSDYSLMVRSPVIIRCDGKGFHKFTKVIKAELPFDERLSTGMANAMLVTAMSMVGCVFGYTQSDEITFVLRNDQSNESEPWFGNRIQKMCSVVASMVSVHFNSHMNMGRACPPAYFDARVFPVPSLVEAANCLLWRQKDATKNSISMAAWAELTKKLGKKAAFKALEGLKQDQRQELLFKECGINWNNYPTKFKRGIACYRTIDSSKDVWRSKWHLDTEIPIFGLDKPFLLEKLSEFHLRRMTEDEDVKS